MDLFVHRFVAGKKRRDVACLCGKVTWAEAIRYWRSVPRHLVLEKAVLWCADPPHRLRLGRSDES